MCSIMGCVPGFKSILTLVIALGFVITLGWFRQTMERSRIEIDHLYATTVIEADILKTNSSNIIHRRKRFHIPGDN